MSRLRPDSSSFFSMTIFYNIRLTTGSIDSPIKLDSKAFAEPRKQRIYKVLNRWPGRKKFRQTRHFFIQNAGIGHSGSAGELFAVAQDGHGAVLKKTPPQATLSAANDLAALHGEFVTGRRNETRQIRSTGGSGHSARLRS